MGDSKKKHTPSPKVETPPQEGPSPLGQMLSHEEMEALSALQLVDLIAGKIPPHHSSLMDLIYLRDRISAMEEMNDQARQALEKLDEIVESGRF
jgi:proteasome-associated ATPase